MLKLIIKLKTIFLSSLCIFVFWGCSTNQKEIGIAVAVPLTGDVAALGQGMAKGAQMAVDEANHSGRFKEKITLLKFDDRADPKEAVNVANLIISNRNILGIIGHLNSGCSIPASLIYSRHNLAMLTPASTNPKLTQQGLKNVFRVCTTDDVQGSFSADYAFNDLKFDKVAIIHDKTPYGQGLAEEFKKEFETVGGKVLFFEGIATGDKDFKALLTSFKRNLPSVIYFGGIYNEGGLITKQAKEVGLKIPMISGDALYTPEYIKIGQEATEGDYITMVGVSPDRAPLSADFIQKYKTKYPGTDLQPYDHYTYETTNILLEAIEKSGKDKLKIIDYISKVKYSGILGITSFDEKGDTLNKAVTIYKIINGKFIPQN